MNVDLFALYDYCLARAAHEAEQHRSTEQAEALACERGGCYHAPCKPDCATCARLERDRKRALGDV